MATTNLGNSMTLEDYAKLTASQNLRQAQQRQLALGALGGLGSISGAGIGNSAALGNWQSQYGSSAVPQPIVLPQQWTTEFEDVYDHEYKHKEYSVGTNGTDTIRKFKPGRSPSFRIMKFYRVNEPVSISEGEEYPDDPIDQLRIKVAHWLYN